MYTWSCEALCIKAFSKWPVMFLVWNNNNKKWWQCWKKGLLSVVPRPRYLQMPTAETTDDAPVVCGFTTSTFPCIFPLCSCVVFFDSPLPVRVHTSNTTLALSSSHLEPVAAQHLLPPLGVSWMRIFDTSGANLNLVASVPAPVPRNPFVQTPPDTIH